MTGRELLVELERSGTPESVLELGVRHLHETPRADASSLLACLMAHTDLQARQRGRDLVSEGTITKARRIMAVGKWVEPAPSAELINARIWLDNQQRGLGIVPGPVPSAVEQALDAVQTETTAEPARPVAATPDVPVVRTETAPQAPVAQVPVPASVAFSQQKTGKR
jgi:hypothetical protein